MFGSQRSGSQCCRVTRSHRAGRGRLVILGLAAVFLARCAHRETPAPSVVAEPPAASDAPTVVALGGGVIVDRARGHVRVPATVVLDEGWLEQVACLRGTREHESLVVVDASASVVHAGLVALGARAGHPGTWARQGDDLVLEPPDGTTIDVDVVVDGRPQDIEAWVVGGQGEALQAGRFRFGGSRQESWGYVADASGSLIGLVTFGDETIGLVDVLPDQIDVQQPVWKARGEAMPPPGTSVTLVLSPR